MSKQECFHHRTVTFFDCHLITTMKLGEFIEWYQAFANSILSRIGVKQFFAMYFSKMWKTGIAEYSSKFSSMTVKAALRIARWTFWMRGPFVSSTMLSIFSTSQIVTTTHDFPRLSKAVGLKPVNIERSFGPSSSLFLSHGDFKSRDVYRQI